MLVDKNNPSDDWIDYVQQKFPCEPEIDRVLTRKLKRRSGPPYSPLTLDDLQAGLQALLQARLDQPFEIRDARWLTGGASKLQMAFVLDWQPPDAARTTTPMVLRMQPAESIVETSRLREFQLVEAMHNVVPAPKPYWVDELGEHLPYPGLVYSFVNGVTKPSANTVSVSGMGTNFGPQLRPVLAQQFVEHLARIHTYDWPDESLDTFQLPRSNTQSVQTEIGHWERVWEEDSDEDIPIMRVAANWLRTNIPPIDQLSILHGDYRAGNFLFDEQTQKITAWLDWENASLGDRHLDLAYSTCSVFGHRDEAGEQFLVCGMLPEDEFYTAYEKASGLTVDHKRLAFYQVLNLYKLITIALVTSCRVMRNGKTHQDITLSWPVAAAYIFLEDLRRELEQVL